MKPVDGCPGWEYTARMFHGIYMDKCGVMVVNKKLGLRQSVLIRSVGQDFTSELAVSEALPILIDWIKGRAA